MFVSLANTIASDGTPVDLVVGSAGGPNVNRVTDAVRLVNLKSSRMLRSLRPLSAYLERERPDVLLSTLEEANVVALAARALARVPVRVVLRVACVGSEVQRQVDMKGRLIIRLHGAVLRFADQVVAISNGVAADLRRMTAVDAAKLQVIYNPAFSDDLLELADRPPGHPWLEGQTPVVLGVGRLDAIKNFGALLRAAAIARRRVPLRVVIAGDGPEKGALQAQAQALGLQDDAAFPGYVGNPYPLIKRAAVLAVPSLTEGFGNVIVEALALGTPVVATRCAGGPSEILDDGRWGRLVPLHDDEAMATALIEAMAQGRRADTIGRARDFALEPVTAKYRQALGIVG
jgi:glycosyltransferase involved in cell wall biosynthesis